MGGASTLAPVTPPLGIHALCYPGPRCLPRCGRSDSMSLPRFDCKNLWPEQTQFNPKQSEAVNSGKSSRVSQSPCVSTQCLHGVCNWPWTVKEAETKRYRWRWSGKPPSCWSQWESAPSLRGAVGVILFSSDLVCQGCPKTG